MRSNKRYTNATFTKRVDHEAGRHRAPRAPTEPRVCESCGAVYARRRWIAAVDVLESCRPDWRLAKVTLCPGCKRKGDGAARGFVYLSGDFLKTHRDEIKHLVQNEAGRALHDNPLARIVDLRASASAMTVTTTTEHFAQRLGQALNKAYGGEVRYDFSHENKLARVWWRRD